MAPVSRLLPPHLFGIALLVTLILVVAIPAWPALEMLRYFGPLFLGLGFWLLIVAHGRFERIGTTINTFGKPKKLVTEGLYRYSRNPMYLGFTLMILGLGLLGGTPWALIPAVAFFATCNWHYIPFEERAAEVAFGADYRAYKARVRRWL